MSAFGRAGLFLVVALAVALGGCSWFGGDRNAKLLATPARFDKGWVAVLPGIEGTGPLNRGIRDGLYDGGVPTGIGIYDWTLGPVLAPLSQMWENRARTEANKLAFDIQQYHRTHPGRPIVLIGHSGGCAVAVFALESLSKDATVTSLIMLAPSISPNYNLKAALDHVEGQAYSFYSSKDAALLGVGTFVFGTLDGKHTSAAGRTGFEVPGDAADIYKAKLKQIPWQPAMELSGNAGGHTDWADRRFIRDYIAPRVNAELKAHAARTTVNRPANQSPTSAAPGPR